MTNTINLEKRKVLKVTNTLKDTLKYLICDRIIEQLQHGNTQKPKQANSEYFERIKSELQEIIVENEVETVVKITKTLPLSDTKQTEQQIDKYIASQKPEKNLDTIFESSIEHCTDDLDLVSACEILCSVERFLIGEVEKIDTKCERCKHKVSSYWSSYQVLLTKGIDKNKEYMLRAINMNVASKLKLKKLSYLKEVILKAIDYCSTKFFDINESLILLTNIKECIPKHYSYLSTNNIREKAIDIKKVKAHLESKLSRNIGMWKTSDRKKLEEELMFICNLIVNKISQELESYLLHTNYSYLKLRWQKLVALKVVNNLKAISSSNLTLAAIINRYHINRNKVFGGFYRKLEQKLQEPLISKEMVEDYYQNHLFYEMERTATRLYMETSNKWSMELSEELKFVSPEPAISLYKEVLSVVVANKKHYMKEQNDLGMQKEEKLKNLLNLSRDSEEYLKVLWEYFRIELKHFECSTLLKIWRSHDSILSKYYQMVNFSWIKLNAVTQSLHRDIPSILLVFVDFENQIDISTVVRIQRELEFYTGHSVNHWGNAPVSYKQIEVKVLEKTSKIADNTLEMFLEKYVEYN